jgi:hypothetical protein
MGLGDLDANRVSGLARSAQRPNDDRPGLLGEPPVAVRVTVIPGPRGPSMRERVADIHVTRRALMLIGLVVVVAAIAALVVTVPLAGHETARSERAQVPEIGTARVAAAYGRPPRCSAGAMAPHHVSSESPVFDRAVWCLRYGDHAAASFYRFTGAP